MNETLHFAFTTDTIELDGDARDAIWQTIPSTKINTSHGKNYNNLGTEVSVKAAHDGTFAYLLIEWADATKSTKHLPLQKTEEGWKVLQGKALQADEDSYYEDKFAVMLSRSNQFGGAGTVHLGKQPHGKHPGSSGGRGLHYTKDGSITDVWHWKSGTHWF